MTPIPLMNNSKGEKMTRPRLFSLLLESCALPACAVALSLGCGGPQKNADPVPERPPVTATPTAPVVEDDGKPVKVDISMDGITADKGAHPLKPGETLKKGDRMAVNVRVDAPSYVYIGLGSADGTANLVYPKSGDKVSTPELPLRFPTKNDAWMVLDANTGQEDVFVYASKKPIPTSDLFNRFSADAAAARAEAKKREATKKPAVTGKKSISPGGMTNDTRGLSVEDDEPEVQSVSSTVGGGITSARFSVKHR